MLNDIGCLCELKISNTNDGLNEKQYFKLKPNQFIVGIKIYKNDAGFTGLEFKFM